MAAPSGDKYVSVVLKDSYAVLSLHKEPVNSFNLAMWQQLELALDALEADTSVNGLIITTGLKKDVFTAGNDIMELYAPRTSHARYGEFWITSNRVLCKLYASRLSTIAAIRGACPAGGCMMSLCCDHRIMTSFGDIGLNEVQLGILVPKYWALLMVRMVGQKSADKLLTTGKMVNPQEAKALGLIDQVVDSKDQLLPVAEKVMQQLVKLPPPAVAGTKRVMREEFCDAWRQYYVQEVDGAWQFLNQPATLRTIEATLQRLSGNKAAGAQRAGNQAQSKL